jgi:hypothetical protein
MKNIRMWLVVSLVLLLASACSAKPTPSHTIAFIGDQSVSTNARAVLQLIADDGADMVLHQGDLGYTSNVAAWEQQIDDILGHDFPYFASVGNHDCASGIAGCSGPGVWPDYQANLLARLSRIDGATCVGEYGVNASCTYKGIRFLLSGVGTQGTGHESFIRNSLADATETWRICSWHKNQRLMQVGGKPDEVGWTVYDECRAGGAIIATGHEHSYARTHLMSNFENQIIESTSNTLAIGPGQSFAFVSGIAGHSIRAQNAGLAANPWWASIYTSTQGADHGALFCTFNVGGVGNRAQCYFKDLGGTIVDQFELWSLHNPPPPVPSVSMAGLVLLAAGLTWLVVARIRRTRASGEPR